MIAGQLQLDVDASVRDQDDLIAKVRASVMEDGMSDAEVDAAVADALDRLGLEPPRATQAQPCLCDHPMLFVAALAIDRRCARCGREPRR